MKLKSVLIAVTVMILIVVALSGAFQVAAVNIDGSILDSEWSGTSVNILFDTSENSNCNVRAAVYRYEIDYDDTAIYFGLKCISDVKSSELEEHLDGIELTINEKDVITATADGLYEYDDYNYSCEAAFSHGIGFQIEMRIGIKNGMQSKYDLAIKIIDEYGSFSNKYSVVLIGQEIIDDTTGQADTTKAEQVTTRADEPAPTQSEDKETTKNKTTVAENTENSTTEKHTIKDTKNITDNVTKKAEVSKNNDKQIKNDTKITDENNALTQSQDNTTAKNIKEVVLNIDNDNSKPVLKESKTKYIMVAVGVLVFAVAIGLLVIAGKTKKSEEAPDEMRTSEEK